MQVTKASVPQLVIVGAFCLAVHPMLALGVWVVAWRIHKKHRDGLHQISIDLRARILERHLDNKRATLTGSW